MVDESNRRDKTKVFTVLRSGGSFTVDHVERLQVHLEMNITRDIEYVCLSDCGEDFIGEARVEPLKHDWPGWWSKIELFRFSGPCLYFDLDTSIHGNIDAIVDHCQNHGLTALRDFNPKDRDLQSSAMAWDGGYSSEIYDYFSEIPEYWMGRMSVPRWWGDQGFIEHVMGGDCLYWQDIFPGWFVSHKKHCRNGVPENARVEVFHGTPRPWDA